jgi:PAS domain S-box-containing protein
LEQEIAERRRTEQELQLEKERAQQYLDVARVVLVALDNEGRITLINKRGLELLGYREAELVGKNWFETCVPEDLREQTWSIFRQSIAGEVGLVEYYENQVLLKDGTERIVAWHNSILRDASGDVVGTLSSGEDITERLRVERESRRRNRELALLNRVIAASTSTLDVKQVLQVTCQELARAFKLPQAAAALLNAEKTEAVVVAEYVAPGGVSALDKFIPVRNNPATEYVLAHKAPLAVADAQTDERMSPVHYLMRERDVLSMLIVPVMERGEVVGTIGLDSMERREFSDEEIALAQSVAAAAGQAMETARLYQELQRRTIELTHALEQREELARLRSEFIRNVSHELRTPLAIARGHAELLESGILGELEDEQLQSVAVIARRMQTLSRIMDDFAAIIDVEGELQRRPVDLAEVLRELLAERQMQEVVQQSNLTLTVKIAPDAPLVSGDAIQLQRAMSNLLDNAVKFTPDGGRVGVNFRQEGECLVLEVADTGIGIPADQFERIFERFYQIDGSTTRRYGGTGLGLALVKEIVEMHGGQVSVQSALGQGSTFSVVLPVCPVDLAPGE